MQAIPPFLNIVRTNGQIFTRCLNIMNHIQDTCVQIKQIKSLLCQQTKSSSIYLLCSTLSMLQTFVISYNGGPRFAYSVIKLHIVLVQNMYMDLKTNHKVNKVRCVFQGQVQSTQRLYYQLSTSWRLFMTCC